MITFFTCFVSVAFCFIVFNKHKHTISRISSERLQNFISNHQKFYPSATDYDRKDWHDWKFIEYEKTREGPGEQGSGYVLTDPADIELNQKVFKENGLYGVVSDKISVNRSIPDTRPAK